MATQRSELTDTLAGISLFAAVGTAQLNAIDHISEERRHAADQLADVGRRPATEPTRPHPPGEYPVVVVGSGPGGLQLSYSLSRAGVRHAVISADPSPGGMFRRWPFFQRLLSWTKPFAPEERG